MYKYLLVIFLMSGFALTVRAQNPALSKKETKKDSVNLHRDSITSKRFVPRVKHDDKVYHPDSLHSPHKAVMRSLILPGLGQLYNHQWWKVPIIYAGLGLLADAIIFNQRQYGPLLQVAHYYEQGKTTSTLPTTAKDYNLWLEYTNAGYQSTTIDAAVDAYRRDRDLSIMGFAAAWGIQMVDAYIDAKFQHSYTMDTDFSYKVAPTIINQQPLYAQSFGGPIIPGLKLTFTLR
jgi:hypothetical protein